LLKRLLAGVPAAGALLIFSLLISAILLENKLDSSLYFPLLLAAAGISGLIGGAFATAKEKKNGLINGALAAVLPAAVYLTAASVLNHGFAPAGLLPCLALLTASVASGIAVANRKTKPKIKKRK